MKRLEVRFPEETSALLSELSAKIGGGVTLSEVARVAMHTGIEQLNKLESHGFNSVTFPALIKTSDKHIKTKDKE